MSTPIVFNAVSYSVPAYNDVGWAQGAGNLSSYLIAIASGTLQQSGGTFSLTADANFGLNFGLLSKYFTSITVNPATAGTVRLAKTDTIDWRNNANSANLALGINGSDQLIYNGAIVQTGTGFVTSIASASGRIIVSTPTGAVDLNLPQAIDVSDDVIFNTVTAIDSMFANDHLDVGLGNTTNGSVVFNNASNTQTVTLRSGTTGTSYPLTLPTAQGAANTFLKNNGSGVLSFAPATGNFVSSITGTANQVIASAATGAVTLSLPQDIATTSSPSFHGLHLIGTPVLTIDGTSNIAIDPGVGNFIDHIRATRFDDILFPNTDATVSIGQAATAFAALYLHGTGLVLRETAAGTDTITLNAPATITTSHSLFLPGTQGAASTFLQNDGSGNLSWAAPTGGGTVNAGTATHLAYYATSTNAVSDANGATVSGAYTFSGVSTFAVDQQFTSGLRFISAGGGANVLTFRSANLATNATYTVPDAGGTANFVMSEVASTINGVKTFGSSPIVPVATTATQATQFSQIKYLSTPIQVVDTTGLSTTSSTYQTTPTAASITPSSASNRVKITVTGTFDTALAAGGAVGFVSLFRGSTNLATSGAFIANRSNASGATRAGASICFIDSPATTSSTTYSVKIRSADNTTSVTWVVTTDAVIIVEEIV